LYYPTDHKDISLFFDESYLAEVDEGEVALAKRLLGRVLDRKWSLTKYTDRKKKAISALIAEAVEGDETYHPMELSEDAQLVDYKKEMRKYLREAK
jgi:non-homologous end joining protein Ku